MKKIYEQSCVCFLLKSLCGWWQLKYAWNFHRGTLGFHDPIWLAHIFQVFNHQLASISLVNSFEVSFFYHPGFCWIVFSKLHPNTFFVVYTYIYIDRFLEYFHIYIYIYQFFQISQKNVPNKNWPLVFQTLETLANFSGLGHLGGLSETSVERHPPSVVVKKSLGPGPLLKINIACLK